MSMTTFTIPANTPSLNSATINAALAAGDVFLELQGGTHTVSCTITVPQHRRFIVRGPGNLTGLGSPVFVIADTVSDPWNGEFRAENVHFYNDGAPAIMTVARPNLNKFIVRDCEFNVSNAYAVDLDIAYSLSPEFRSCRFGAMKHGAAIRIRGDVHTTSGLRIADVHCHYQEDKLGPCVWLEGCQMAYLSSVIIEGSDGIRGPEGLEYKTQGLLVVNPGYRGSVYENLWFEWWNAGTPSDLRDMTIFNTFTGSAGAYAPGPQAVRNTSGRFHFGTVDQTYDHLTVLLQHCGPDTVGRVTTAGTKTSVIADGVMIAPLSPAPPGIVVAPNSQIYVRTAVQTETNFRRSLVSDTAYARILYEYRGGNGLHQPNHRPYTGGRGAVFPHRHPVYGPCLAVLGMPDINLPGLVHGDYRKLNLQERHYARVRIAAPYNTLTGNGTHCPVFLGVGNTSEALWVPDGYVPVDHAYSDIVTSISNLFSIHSAPYVGMGGGPRPGKMWLLLYHASFSTGSHAPAHSTGNGMIECYEAATNAGPPAGTWDVGDRVRLLSDPTKSWWCTNPGTSRVIRLTVDTEAGSPRLHNVSDITSVLEGDWISVGNLIRARVLTVNPTTNDLVLDQPVKSALLRTVAANNPPVWSKV